MKKRITEGAPTLPRLHQTGFDPEKSNQVSMTEPDQVHPLEKILTHRNRGIPVPVFNGVFSSEDTPDIQKLDFIEIAQLREETQAIKEAANEDLHALNKAHEALLQKQQDALRQKREEGQEKPQVSPQQ